MKKQQGMTLIGGLLTVIIIVFVGVMIMRAVPIYIKNYEIVSSIKSLNTTPMSSLAQGSEANVNVLMTSLWKRLEINGDDDIGQNAINITPIDATRYKVTLKYQETRPFMFNIKLLFDFDNTYEVQVGH